jgi:DNA repair protein RecO (recombination protein O)
MAYHTTQGIVFNSIKYRDNDLIVRIYTQDFGLLSFMVNGARKKKSKKKASYFQPLSILNLEISYSEKRELHSIKELHLERDIASIHQDIAKSSIALFMAELLHKSIQEEEQNPALYSFLLNAINFLNDMQKGVANFHSIFLLQLSTYLGIQPSMNKGELPYFNLEEGQYVNSEFMHDQLLNEEESMLFHKCSQLSILELDQLNLSAKERKNLLIIILQYYRIHLPETGNLKSLDVLTAVFA